MLLQRKKATKSVSIMDHQTIHAPVNPRAIRVLSDHGVPSTDIPTAIAAVNQRNRELKNVNIVTQKNVFFAWPGVNSHRRDEFPFSLQIGLHDFFGCRMGRQLERKGSPGKQRMFRTPAGSER